MHDFKKLQVWKKAMELVKKIYIATEPFPKTEMYGLTNQVRRSAVSIPSNIAEGSGRSTNKDFKLFLHTAYGSSCELETQLLLSIDLEFATSEELVSIKKDIEDIQKMLFGLIEKFT